jgi:hypothetical protein
MYLTGYFFFSLSLCLALSIIKIIDFWLGTFLFVISGSSTYISILESMSSLYGMMARLREESGFSGGLMECWLGSEYKTSSTYMILFSISDSRVANMF